jgi:TRAP-type C4-dicarboxylate transport system permease small subunit
MQSGVMKISKWLNLLHKTAAYSIAIIFGLMVMAGALQVTNRYFFNSSLSWSEEFQKFAHIWIICLTIPVAYRNSAHLGMDIICRRLPERYRSLFNQLVNTLWLLSGVLLAIFSLALIKVAENQMSPGLGISMGWIYSGLFIGNVYLIITAIQKLIENAATKEKR